MLLPGMVSSGDQQVSVPFNAGRGLMRRLCSAAGRRPGRFQYPSMRVVD